MLTHSLSDALEAARHGEQCGSVVEVNSKRLLALNLRKLAGAELEFTPRSYILTKDVQSNEFDSFVRDFKASQAFAVLKYVSTLELPKSCTCCDASSISLPKSPHASSEGIYGREIPELTWLPGPDPKQPITVECVRVAIDFTERALPVLGDGGKIASLIVDDSEWDVLRGFSSDACRHCHADLSVYAAKAWQLIRALTSECQLELLRNNVWILKPSMNGGGNGRGILLMDRLPASGERLLCWAAAVGRGGVGGVQDALDGCLLQKLVEEPHLLNQQQLEACQMEDCISIERDGDSHTVEQQSPQYMSRDLQKDEEQPFKKSSAIIPLDAGLKFRPALFKYNFRLWILASMASSPAVYLYRDSYVDLAAKEFTPELDPASHVTNLLRGHRTSQRYWPIPVFASHLRRVNNGHDLYSDCLFPQARHVICKVFEALQISPTSLLDKTTARLKRLGVDLLVDSNHRVWLMEINVLRNEYGLKAAKGQDTKTDLAKRLMEEEVKLKSALSTGSTLPETWEDLSHCIASSSEMPSM